VADNELPLFRAPRPTLRHLPIPHTPLRVDAAPGQRGFPQYQRVDRREHGRSLNAQIASLTGELNQIAAERQQAGLPAEVNLILELETAAGYKLSANEINSLTAGTHVQLLFAHPERTSQGAEFTRALLHVPYGQLAQVGEKFRRYAEETTAEGKTPNPWAANIQRIARAALRSLWTDTVPMPDGDTAEWWELWVRREEINWLKFERYAQQTNIRLKGARLVLPEHFVIVAEARRSQLEGSLDLLDTLAEVRKARSCHYQLTHLAGNEQHEWIELAAQRIEPPGEDAPAVCLLDTGVNRGHRLLEAVLAETDNHTIFPDGDPSDSEQQHGHGTPMAGLAAYGDLNQLLLTNGQWPQRHRLEAVKTFDRTMAHEPENYGSVSAQAVHTPEVTKPRRTRVFSLPITALGGTDGRPSAWSAALDALAYGAEEPDEPKRLFFVSAGNTSPFDDTGYAYPATCEQSPLEDPSQAWNVVTVGALTNRAAITENDPESTLLEPVAMAGSLSPHSRTSLPWDRHWPIKPDIVMEGGNLGRHPNLGIERRDSLDLITTSRLVRNSPIAAFRATSAATALAARLGAEIFADYPNLWPETVRGLIVHSARWSPAMLNGCDPHRPGSRLAVERILRRYGHGEPDLDRARACSQSEVTFFRQDTLTPYEGTAGAARTKDCHIHQLRLPVELIQSLGNTACTLRVTLSSFVAPNPSASNRIPGSRYRYGGSPLRFRVRHKDESEENFLALVSREADDGEDNAEPESLVDPAWALGAQLRGKSGSLVHDVWRGPAVDLATMDRIAVFPVKGWWAVRSFPTGSPWHHCHRRSIRYSLIVSVEVEADVPLYTEISNLLTVPVDAT